MNKCLALGGNKVKREILRAAQAMVAAGAELSFTSSCAAEFAFYDLRKT
jgi:hypothetical protein